LVTEAVRALFLVTLSAITTFVTNMALATPPGDVETTKVAATHTRWHCLVCPWRAI
jgi:hypothetical protein